MLILHFDQSEPLAQKTSKLNLFKGIDTRIMSAFYKYYDKVSKVTLPLFQWIVVQVVKRIALTCELGQFVIELF